MKALSGEELKHFRHDLRTPINHILGYTDMLVEDAEEIGVAAFTPELRRVNAGGRALLEIINGFLGEGAGSVSAEEIDAFGGRLRGRAEGLLSESQALEACLATAGIEEARADMARVSAAFVRLLGLVSGTAEAPATPPPPEPAKTEPVAKAVSPEPAEGGGRILIAEDNPANRDLLRRRLEKEGHRVEEAENGVRALERLASGKYDLLLLDLMMPEMNGFEVLASLKESGMLLDLPVIMISALDEIASVVRCIEMGAEDFLPKPFDPVLLRARIGASLEKKRLRDRERQKTEELERALQQLKEMQDQLVVQEKMASLGSLTAGIAHEIKNPLNFVTNFAILSRDLLKELEEMMAPQRAAMPPDDAEYANGMAGDLASNLDKILEHGRRADSIVRGMLAHSRGGGSQRETVDINALVAEAVNLAYHGLRAQDSSFNIALENDFDRDLAPISVVPQDLSRVFLNIANNGCYASHQRKLKQSDGYRPTLTTTTRRIADGVEVRIRDNGTGIPPAVLQKIFNPFFTTKPTGQGTGLGLSLSYQIVVDQHKGSIKVNSQEGEFTEFVIALPR